MMPVVAQGPLWLGVAPVAKALGLASSMMYTLGMGMWARCASSATMLQEVEAASTSRALYIFNTI